MLILVIVSWCEYAYRTPHTGYAMCGVTIIVLLGAGAAALMFLALCTQIGEVSRISSLIDNSDAALKSAAITNTNVLSKASLAILATIQTRSILTEIRDASALAYKLTSSWLIAVGRLMTICVAILSWSAGWRVTSVVAVIHLVESVVVASLLSRITAECNVSLSKCGDLEHTATQLLGDNIKTETA